MEVVAFLYLRDMELSFEAQNILYAVAFVSVGLVLVGYLTRNSRNFRSSRNSKVRKQH